MLSQQDKTFCSSDCQNTECHRHRKHCWVLPRGHELPIATADFSSECEDYQSPEEKQDD